MESDGYQASEQASTKDTMYNAIVFFDGTMSDEQTVDNFSGTYASHHHGGVPLQKRTNKIRCNLWCSIHIAHMQCQI
jgi:hypothetical protein